MKPSNPLLILLLVLLPFLVSSQSINKKDIDLLNSHLSAYNLSFKELVASRGLPDYPNDGKASLNILVNRLRNYVYPYNFQFSTTNANDVFSAMDITNPSREENIYTTNILFYHHSGDTLYSWLIGVNGIEAVGSEKLTAQRMHDLEITFKNELDVWFSATDAMAIRG